ncbi:hypothetical protein ACN42_g3 [Penicillium freii]|uniref:Uncharacterized protein n=1 Tax=Penicillium freii TaxID=48697 RepID=A0A117NT56_PENFR|nr:hypothetical protein ACN42_g3 [Penicillium freii]
MARILELPKKPEPLAVTSLSLLEIQKILGLTLVVDEEFDSVTPIPVPQDLKLWLGKADRAYGASYANEASIRYKLNLLLVCAHDLVLSSSNESTRPLNIQMERCVHKQRKDLGKTDTTVYGISTDAMNSTFMKLDNESRWSFKLVGVVGNGFEQVLGLLVYMMKKKAVYIFKFNLS